MNSSDPTLRVPYTVRAGIAAGLMAGFVLFFVVLAIHNLINYQSIRWLSLFSSIGWLVLVFAVLAGIAYGEGGFRPYFTELVGLFTTRQRLWIETSVSSDPVLAIGYEMFGRRFYYRRVQLSGVTEVSWNAGQGSHMSGKNLDDWTVAVWYQVSSVLTPPKPHLRHDDVELDIVGMPGSQAEIEAWGLQVVDFLVKSGVQLVPGNESGSFKNAAIL